MNREQLLGLGLGKDAIQHRIASGRLHRLHAGVYAVGHQVIAREGRWMAAVLASGPGAVLSHWSAAHLWMVRPNSRSRIDVTVAHRSRSSKSIRRHISAVPDDERTTKVGIPTTSVPRTILDLAATDGHSTRTAFREDRARDRRLTAAGYRVTHITWNQLDDEPLEIASDLRALLQPA